MFLVRDMAKQKRDTIQEIEDDIRDIINFVEIKRLEELEVGEGKKIEDDTATELIDKLKQLAAKIGRVGLFK